MKKLIAILAVFAFMTAALFAQDAGTWSLSGNGQINTRIDFKPLFDNAEKAPPTNHAQIGASNYGDEGSFSNGDVKGNLTIGYKKGIIAAEISFNQRGAMGANFQANGENWQFRASRDLGALLLNQGGFGDLWGNYTFQVLEGIFVEAAVSKGGAQWNTISDTWSGDGGSQLNTKNYLLVNAKPIAGLEIGFKLPDIFTIDSQKDFLDDSLRRLVFGVRYNVSPIDVSAQFALNKYGLDYLSAPGNNRIYFGAKYTINSEMWAGAYFRGQFGFKNYTTTGDKPEAVDSASLVFGGEFSYTSGPLGAGLNLRFEEPSTALTADAPKNKAQLFVIGGNVRYDVISTHLRVKLGFEIQMPLLGEDAEKARKETLSTSGFNVGRPTRTDTMLYTFTPEITYNFLGSGAGDDPGVGMRIKYRVQGRAEAPLQTQNELTIAFKWSF